MLHSPWSTMLKHKSCYMVDDAKTQKLLHSPWSTMLKHRSYYTVHGRRCWNTKAVHNSWSRCWNTEEVVTHPKTDDAETQRKLLHSQRSTTTLQQSHVSQAPTIAPTWECWNSQERKSHGWNSPRFVVLKQHQQQRERTVTPFVTTTPHSTLVIAFCCARLGHPILV